ncbi:MAG: CoA-binding protein [Actinomycetia bacterium]|jgi:hypothetical protein|nr:CoA-binding protein [Actinomycetes bacterium]
MDRYGDVAVMRRLLIDSTTWAVVGLGENPARPAYEVAEFLRSQGKRIVPVHPAAATVLGEPGFPTLSAVPFPVDVVDLFVAPARVGAIVDEAIAVGAPAVWLQLGVVDEAAAARARAAGLDVVMNYCPKLEAPRLLSW